MLTPLLLLWGRFENARYCAAVAVGAVVTGWAVAQSPYILPGVTADEAAAENIRNKTLRTDMPPLDTCYNRTQLHAANPARSR